MMPRKIEVRDDGVWRPFDGGMEEAKRLYLNPRYVGGVLEYRSTMTGNWVAEPDQSREVILSCNPNWRLRPYDDAAPQPLTASVTIAPSTWTKEMRLTHRVEGNTVHVDVSGIAKSRAEDERDQLRERLGIAITSYEAAEARADELDRRLREVSQTAGRRGDELGTARTRITELEAECFRLRRRAEDAERKVRR